MKKNVAKRALYRAKRIFLKICNTVHFLISSKKDVLVVNAWMTMYNENPRHFTLGDELNFYLIKALTSYEIFNYADLYVRHRINFCCIGSIIDSDMLNKDSIIWGTGAIEGIKKIGFHPRKICAVRGKLTREYLISQGIDCPAVYGDPALLTPLVYNPRVKKKYVMGIIPHYVDMNNPLVTYLQNLLPGRISVIKMQGYNDWHEVIDEIKQCNFVVSSSLHGLILADAYQVPNIWVELSDNVTGEGFKFRDYFSSVDRNDKNPLKVNKSLTIDDIYSKLKSWKKISIDLDKLIQACPFNCSKFKYSGEFK